MNTSKHAEARSQQRGIPKADIDLILAIGTGRYKPSGAIEYTITKKAKNQIISRLKRWIDKIDRINTKAVLQSADQTIITLYHRN